MQIPWQHYWLIWRNKSTRMVLVSQQTNIFWKMSVWKLLVILFQLIRYYHLTSKTGIFIPRQWLCFSIVMSNVYCETCRLFANRLNPNFKYNCIHGICDWQNLSTKIMKREKSHQHLEAVQIRLLWVKNEKI